MNKELLTKLLSAAQELVVTPKADYIHLSEEFIQKKADEENVSFEEMVNIIENYLKPKQ
jgi:hypothetical protein